MTLIRERETYPSDLDTKPHRLPHFAFVDADNLKRGLETRLNDLDVPSDLRSHFRFYRLFEDFNFDRIYVYSAVEDQASLPSWLTDLRALQRVVLKLGTLTRKSSGASAQRKQEGVDVQLAIDATRFAYTSTMKTCTIFGADGDFIPLVEAISESGCIINVASFNNPDKGRVAPKLQAAADDYQRINGCWIHRTLDSESHTVTLDPRNGPTDWRFVEQTIKIHGVDVKVAQRDNRYYARFDDGKRSQVFTSPSLQDLTVWGRLNYIAAS